jgi:hypothetical protein
MVPTAMFVALMAIANLSAGEQAIRLTDGERQAMRAIKLTHIAESTLRRAGRPAGADMRHVAVASGFKIVPRAPRGLDSAYEGGVVAYRYHRDPVIRGRRVAEGLAAGLLTQLGETCSPDNIRDLATLLLAGGAS